jgi:hypothetical protein
VFSAIKRARALLHAALQVTVRGLQVLLRAALLRDVVEHGDTVKRLAIGLPGQGHGQAPPEQSRRPFGCIAARSDTAAAGPRELLDQVVTDSGVLRVDVAEAGRERSSSGVRPRMRVTAGLTSIRSPFRSETTIPTSALSKSVRKRASLARSACSARRASTATQPGARSNRSSPPLRPWLLCGSR